jgi:flagellar biosynthesis protein FlhF
VAAAIREARQDLGEDALLLRSRRAPEEYVRFGAYEVVFGVQESPEEEPSGHAPEERHAHSREVLDFSEAGATEPSRRQKRLSATLIGFDLDKPLARSLAARIEARLPAPKPGLKRSKKGQFQRRPDCARQVMREELDRFFPRDLGAEGDFGGRVLAVCGPPGSGKTSAILRLAVRYGVAYGRRTVLLAAEDHRIAGSERLLRHAELLGVECRLADSLEELGKALESRRKNDFFLIDSPGLARREVKSAAELAAWLAASNEIQRHLVLPATMKRSDLQDCIRSFAPFRPDRLLFTKLDETREYGSIFSAAAASGIPISFLTSGQQAPGNILPASRLRLSRLLQATARVTQKRVA